MPGTKMTFAGMPKAEDRANVLAYLRTLSDNPEPLPAVTAQARPRRRTGKRARRRTAPGARRAAARERPTASRGRAAEAIGWARALPHLSGRER